jgi:general transcription factor 3C polypeptide 3 (transcription factor C subunit 4)
VEELALLAKYFEASGNTREAIKRGKQTYNKGGLPLLKRLQFNAIGAAMPDWMPSTPKGRGPYNKRTYLNVGEISEEKREVQQKKSAERRARLAMARATLQANIQKRPLKPQLSRPEKGTNLEDAEMMDAPLPSSTATTSGPVSFQPYVVGFSVEAEDEGVLSPLAAINKRIWEAERLRPDEFAYQKSLDRQMRAGFALLQELQEDVKKGDPLATSKCLDAGEEMTTELLDFTFFFHERMEPFKGYFRKKGPEWREAILSRLAYYANRVDDGERDLDFKSDEFCHDFHGVDFEDWLGVIVQHALLLAKTGESAACFGTLKGACRANIFLHFKERLYRIYTCWLACAIQCDDSHQTVHAVRWFMKHYPYASDIYRLYSMANRMLGEGSWYSTAMNQKAILRYIKAADYQQMTPEQRDWFKYNDTMRANYVGKVVREGMLQHVAGHDPILFSLFGHTLADGGTYTAALNYYFRAFVICPDDPILNLCIGLCYVQHAMKRQSENRQYQVQQGMAFVFRYHEIRTRDDVAGLVQEAEFNMGRVWHMLGLSQLALAAYRRCMELGPRVREEHEKGEQSGTAVEDFSAEAAFAIQTILALAGDFERARKVTEESLVIE